MALWIPYHQLGQTYYFFYYFLIKKKTKKFNQISHIQFYIYINFHFSYLCLLN